MKNREQRERDERTEVNSVRIRLDLRTEMVSFVIFWTFLLFVQISGVVSETYLFFFFAELMHISNPALFVLTQTVQFTFFFPLFSSSNLLPLSKFVCPLFHFRMSQNIILFLKIKIINLQIFLL